MDFFNFSRELTRLRKAGQHREVLQFFKTHKGKFNIDATRGSSYVVSAILISLKETGQAGHVLGFLNTYNVKLDQSTDEWVLRPVAWGIRAAIIDIVGDSEMVGAESADVDSEGDGCAANLGELCNAAAILVPLLLERNDESLQLPAIQCLSALSQVAKKRGGRHWQVVADVSAVVSPSALSIKTQAREEAGRRSEYASNLEVWYAIRARALYETAAYAECVACVDAAQEAISRFHYGNDVWLPRLRAKAKAELGEFDPAIRELNDLLRRKPDWFMHHDLAVVLAKAGQREEAVRECRTAMAMAGVDDSKKVGIIYLLGELLETLGQRDMAAKHALYVHDIRSKHGWTISDDLTALVARLVPEGAGEQSTEQLRVELRQYWRQTPGSAGVTPEREGRLQTGKITKVLHNNDRGLDGFLRNDDGEDFYFRLFADSAEASSIREGVTVEFQALPAHKEKTRRSAQIRIVLS